MPSQLLASRSRCSRCGALSALREALACMLRQAACPMLKCPFPATGCPVIVRQCSRRKVHWSRPRLPFRPWRNARAGPPCPSTERKGGRFSLAFALALLAASPVHAEQKAVFGDREAHYVVFPSIFLSAEIAQRYGLPRAKDISILNLSVLDAAGQGTPAQLAGRTTNLLGQISPLTFREIREGQAIYYLAEIRHANREVLRFALEIKPPEGEAHQLRFQQELFWAE